MFRLTGSYCIRSSFYRYGVCVCEAYVRTVLLACTVTPYTGYAVTCSPWSPYVVLAFIHGSVCLAAWLKTSVYASLAAFSISLQYNGSLELPPQPWTSLCRTSDRQQAVVRALPLSLAQSMPSSQLCDQGGGEATPITSPWLQAAIRSITPQAPSFLVWTPRPRLQDSATQSHTRLASPLADATHQGQPAACGSAAWKPFPCCVTNQPF